MWRQEKERGKKRTLLLWERTLYVTTSNFVESYCCAYLLIFTYYHHHQLYYDKTYLKQAVCWLLLNAYAAWLYNILLFWLFRTTLNWAGTTCLSELSKTICWNCLRTMLIIIIAHDIMHMSKNVPTQTQDRNLSDSWANGRFNLSLSKPAVGCQC